MVKDFGYRLRYDNYLFNIYINRNFDFYNLIKLFLFMIDDVKVYFNIFIWVNDFGFLCNV